VTHTTARPPELEQQLRVPETLERLTATDTTRERFFAQARLLWDRRRLLLRAAAVGLVCATLLAFLIPKRYKSQALLMPPDSNSSGALALMSVFSAGGQPGGAGVGPLGSMAGDLLGMKTTGELFVGVLRSRTVEDGIVDQFELRKVYHVRFQESARKRLEENTEINEDRKSGIISLVVTDNDARRATDIATAYVNELDLVMAKVSTSSARRERIFLEQRIERVKQDLEFAEKSFGQFASKNGAIDIPAQGKAMVEAAARLEGEIIAAQSQVEGLRQIYTDDNVRVRSAQARIAELRRQLNKVSGPTTSAEADGTSGEPYPVLRQLPVLGVPWADLYRDVKVEDAVFEVLTKEYELAKVQEAKEIPSVKVLDAPQIPEYKAFPPRLLIMLIGTCLSLSLTTVWILGGARWHTIAEHDPGKQLAREIFEAGHHTVKTAINRVPWFSRNGSHADLSAQSAERFEQDGDDGPRN